MSSQSFHSPNGIYSFTRTAARNTEALVEFQCQHPAMVLLTVRHSELESGAAAGVHQGSVLDPAGFRLRSFHYSIERPVHLFSTVDRHDPPGAICLRETNKV